MKTKTKRIAVILSATGAILLPGVALGACGTETEPAPKQDNGISRGLGTADASKDVKFGDLKIGDFSDITIPVIVTNNSSEASDYTIEATLYNEDGVKVGTAMAYISDVAPGGKAKDELLGMAAGATQYKPSLIERIASVQ